MAWRRAVGAAAAVVVLLSAPAAAQNNVCPPGQFSVSVLDQPEVKCLASRPCSGVYGPSGLVGGVGACPSSTGCALLPHNPSVMGCVPEGRADVSYVNADGSLTRNGVVIAGPPSEGGNNGNNGGNNGDNNNGGNNGDNNSGTNGGNNNGNNGGNNGGNNSGSNGGNNSGNNGNTDGTNGGNNGNGGSPATPTPSSSTNVPTPAHVRPGGSSSSSDGSSSNNSTSSSSSGKSSHSGSHSTAEITHSPTPSANQQNALDDINGDRSKSNRGSGSDGGLGLGSVIAIILGCLAVVAIIAGVFFLRKNKEQPLETPADAENYGNGCITPKENVLLL